MDTAHQHSDRRRRPRWWRALAVMGLAAPLAAAACSSSGSTGSAVTVGKPGGTLQAGTTFALTTLDPLPFGAKNAYLYNMLYDTPIVMQDQKPAPALISSWSLNSADTSATLHLRPGVTYSDGTPFNSSALVWNINWEKQPANAAHALSLWQQVTATATGPETVQLRMARPMPAILGMLAGAPIVKPGAPASGIGTGPFKVSKFVPGQSLTVVRNPHYWQPGQPKLDSIVVTGYSDNATAALALQSGTIQLLIAPPADQVASLKSAGDKALSAPPTYDGYVPSLLLSLLVNTSTPPLNNVKVRQALSLAFDRAQFVSTALSGLGRPADSVFSPASPAYQPSPGTDSYDLAQAKSLLQQAGVTNLSLSVDTVSILPQTTFMPVFQQDLAKIGVHLTINTIDPVTWATIVGPGRFPDLITQENGFVDSDPAINFGNRDLEPAGNSEHFSSPQYTALVQAAVRATNPATRQADYEKVGAYLQQQDIIIPLAIGGTPSAMYAQSVGGVQVGFAGIPQYGLITVGS